MILEDEDLRIDLMEEIWENHLDALVDLVLNHRADLVDKWMEQKELYHCVGCDEIGEFNVRTTPGYTSGLPENCYPSETRAFCPNCGGEA